jgi:hypothetical protein
MARLEVRPAPQDVAPAVSALGRVPADAGKIRFTFTTNVDAEIEARVFGRMGEPVRSVFRGLLTADRHELEWDGRGARGVARAGWYRIVVTARAVSGQRAVSELRVWLAR